MLFALAFALAAAPSPATLIVVDDAPVADQAPGFVIDAIVRDLGARGLTALRASQRAPDRVATETVEARVVVDDKGQLVLTVTRRPATGGDAAKSVGRAPLATLPAKSGITAVVDGMWGPAASAAIPEVTSTASTPPPILKKEDGPAGKVTAQLRNLDSTGGSLAKEIIQKVINQHIGEIQYCYEKALQTKPGLKGKVVLEWIVDETGRVANATIKTSTLDSADAAGCMVTKLSKWQFPKPTGGTVRISFPFVFNTV